MTRSSWRSFRPPTNSLRKPRMLVGTGFTSEHRRKISMISACSEMIMCRSHTLSVPSARRLSLGAVSLPKFNPSVAPHSNVSTHADTRWVSIWQTIHAELLMSERPTAWCHLGSAEFQLQRVRRWDSAIMSCLGLVYGLSASIAKIAPIRRAGHLDQITPISN